MGFRVEGKREIGVHRRRRCVAVHKHAQAINQSSGVRPADLLVLNGMSSSQCLCPACLVILQEYDGLARLYNYPNEREKKKERKKENRALA